ncbi:MAG: hypothetical protein RLZZ387_3448, partial [Chloroflexota bacterium]
SSDRTTGGRTPTFTLDDLTRVAGADGTVRRAALIDTLGCSTTTADRLLLEGQERGLLTRDGRGVYRLRGAG